MNDEFTEVITFAPKQKVSFHQFKSPREGVIVNEVVEDGELQLRFYCYHIGGRHAGQRTGAGRHNP